MDSFIQLTAASLLPLVSIFQIRAACNWATPQNMGKWAFLDNLRQISGELKAQGHQQSSSRPCEVFSRKTYVPNLIFSELLSSKNNFSRRELKPFSINFETSRKKSILYFFFKNNLVRGRACSQLLSKIKTLSKKKQASFVLEYQNNSLAVLTYKSSFRTCDDRKVMKLLLSKKFISRLFDRCKMCKYQISKMIQKHLDRFSGPPLRCIEWSLQCRID